MKTCEYLAAVKAKLNISSDYKLAKALGITRQAASRYSLGLAVPSSLVAFKIAEILGDQPSAVIADFEAERAEKAGNSGDLAEWQTIMQRLGGAAASILLVAGLGGFPSSGAGSGVVPDVSTTRTSSRSRRVANPSAARARAA